MIPKPTLILIDLIHCFRTKEPSNEGFLGVDSDWTSFEPIGRAALFFLDGLQIEELRKVKPVTSQREETPV